VIICAWVSGFVCYVGWDEVDGVGVGVGVRDKEVRLVDCGV